MDMFPHTPHMELVMVFERIEYETRPPLEAKAASAAPVAEMTAVDATAPGVLPPTSSASLPVVDTHDAGEEVTSVQTPSDPSSGSTSTAASQPNPTSMPKKA